MITIRDAMTDRKLFGDLFAAESWQAWTALLCGFYGLALNREERRIFEAITRRADSPQEACEELWLVIGRRGGKSQVAALLAIFESAFQDYSARLSPGEVATVLVIAADRKQARAVFRYISGLLNGNPMLRAMIVREDRESIELDNRTVIEVGTANFRSVRGYTMACVIADEIAFWRSEDSANPDFEIINALRPAMATLGGKLIALSSPYSKRGALWDAFKRYFGKDGGILVAQAPTRTMNPGLPQKVVDRAMERDPEAAKAEYLAEFRNDLETFISTEIVDDCTVPGRIELPPLSEHRYTAFTDPSGGSGSDSMTLAIAHKEGDLAVLDAVRAIRPPFSPEAAVSEFAALCKSYRCTSVTGDRFAGEFPRELFRKQGIEYRLADRPRSDLYRDMLPMLNSGRVELLDVKQLRAELVNLERRTAKSGKDSINHPTGGHDDLVNSAAGALVSLTGTTPTCMIYLKKRYRSKAA